mmetsp:Transcript_28106/g.45561  ORF Transcript_28106/g.45561 Transcript_28106/m.45561 type:complete len:210 (-) Transcript_28106:309-938(-)|eukprot:CAMPEP_0184650652 /NCGR_PEP_ID=MMETSP0308-20130426/8224_1 /TAXON_ID=38269 /ORGANISM="Gloeochaete witrockiana, Strain SAG 46.84" /LENGTH=209 /DNA_ID=CAMNT_0027084351 /DNA_START=403 /DNA_END=1032 /DNA_ORIENTATION=+
MDRRNGVAFVVLLLYVTVASASVHDRIRRLRGALTDIAGTLRDQVPSHAIDPVIHKMNDFRSIADMGASYKSKQDVRFWARLGSRWDPVPGTVVVMFGKEAKVYSSENALHPLQVHERWIRPHMKLELGRDDLPSLIPSKVDKRNRPTTQNGERLNLDLNFGAGESDEHLLEGWQAENVGKQKTKVVKQKTKKATLSSRTANLRGERAV